MKTFDALIKRNFRKYICSIKSKDSDIRNLKLKCLKLVEDSFFPIAKPKLEKSYVNVTPHRVEIDKAGLTDLEKLQHIEDFLKSYYYIYKTNNHKDLKCPVCFKKFSIDRDYIKSYDDIKDCTTDCPNCNALLIITDEGIEPFHRSLNKTSGGIWPRDGVGCGYIEF